MKLEQVGQDPITGNLKFESVDQIVIESINSIESDGFDKRLLLAIYGKL
jgi:hypothetical protein